MLAHAEIVVRAPDGNVLRSAVIQITGCAGEITGMTAKLGKDAIAFLVFQSGNRLLEHAFVIHRLPLNYAWSID